MLIIKWILALIISFFIGKLISKFKLPSLLGWLIGGIALATAPAPALSIVQEFKTTGPVTSTLIPMAALDDIVGVICFFSTIALVVMKISGGNVPIYIVPIMITLPIII